MLELWLRNNSESKLKYRQKFYLESHRDRSEPAGLYGLRKQVTEAKQGGTLKLRRKPKIFMSRKRRGWGKAQPC